MGITFRWRVSEIDEQINFVSIPSFHVVHRQGRKTEEDRLIARRAATESGILVQIIADLCWHFDDRIRGEYLSYCLLIEIDTIGFSVTLIALLWLMVVMMCQLTHKLKRDIETREQRIRTEFESNNWLPNMLSMKGTRWWRWRTERRRHKWHNLPTIFTHIWGMFN